MANEHVRLHVERIMTSLLLWQKRYQAMEGMVLPLLKGRTCQVHVLRSCDLIVAENRTQGWSVSFLLCERWVSVDAQPRI
jgi:hypothetical protein